MDRPLVSSEDGNGNNLDVPEKERQISETLSRYRSHSGSRRSSVAKAIKKIANYPEIAGEADEYVFDKSQVS